MYVYVVNNEPQSYYFSIMDMQHAFPNFDIPDAPDDDYLTQFGIYRVQTNPPPVLQRDQYWERLMPKLIDGVWVDQLFAVTHTDEEKAQLAPAEAGIIRRSRSRDLMNTDWTQMPDNKLTSDEKTAWAVFRQALRDIPQQEGFPWVVTWPTPPQPITPVVF
jgi:Phage tail assembly chaperone protein